MRLGTDAQVNPGDDRAQPSSYRQAIVVKAALASETHVTAAHLVSAALIVGDAFDAIDIRADPGPAVARDTLIDGDALGILALDAFVVSFAAR